VLQTCRLCCGLVTDLLVTHRGSRQLVTDLLQGNWCSGFVENCCGEVANLLQTCRLCCGLVMDLLVTHRGSCQLLTDLLQGNWCNGFWPLRINFVSRQ